MQITVKSTKVLKTGSNAKGDWELIGLTSTDGKDFTTFHKGVKNLKPGTVVQLDEVTIKDDKTSFKEYTVVSEPSASTSTAPAPTSGMTPQDWAEKDRLERRSREVNTCFMGISSIAQAYVTIGIDPCGAEEFGGVYKNALKWADAHFQMKATGTTAAAKPESQGEKDWQTIVDEGRAWTPGSFLTHVTKELGFTLADVRRILGVKDVKDIANFPQALDTLKEEADKGKE